MESTGRERRTAHDQRLPLSLMVGILPLSPKQPCHCVCVCVCVCVYVYVCLRFTHCVGDCLSSSRLGKGVPACQVLL